MVASSPEHFQSKGPFSDHPSHVFWEVTRACSLACQHCRSEAQPSCHADELTEAEAFTLVEQLAELAPLMLILTGGDPMLRRDILSIARHANDAGLRVGLSPACTNRLMHFDFRAIREAGIERISLSLDGACQKTHDMFRGEKGSFSRGIDAIAMARNAGISVQINTTLTRSSLGEFDEFHELMLKLKPERWKLSVLVPTDHVDARQIPDPEKLEALFERISDLGGESPFAIRIAEAPHFNRVLAQRGKPIDSGDPGPVSVARIRDSRRTMFISHTGIVSPSSFLPFDCGQIRSRHPAEIYREHPLFVSLRDPDTLGGRCGRCEFREICGGSRSRAYRVSQDAFAEDPCCGFQPES